MFLDEDRVGQVVLAGQVRDSVDSSKSDGSGGLGVSSGTGESGVSKDRAGGGAGGSWPPQLFLEEMLNLDGKVYFHGILVG